MDPNKELDKIEEEEYVTGTKALKRKLDGEQVVDDKPKKRRESSIEEAGDGTAVGYKPESSEEGKGVFDEYLTEKPLDEKWKEKNDFHPDRKKFIKLVNWMTKHGAYTERLRPKHYAENQRGVHAAANIEAGDTILFIPEVLLLTIDKIKAALRTSPIGREILDK